MGMLVNGVWQQSDEMDGRPPGLGIRNWITADGSPGPSGEAGFAAEPGRYHLYVSRACPWAHRTTIFRELKGLQDMIGVSVTHWLMGNQGWTFEPGRNVVPDGVNGVRYLHQLYTLSEPGYSGRVSVPVLWDKARGRIVSNESAEIIRMFNSAFDSIGAGPGNFYPEHLRVAIDAFNDRIFETLNFGVYKAGLLAKSQSDYDAAVFPLFETLDWLEARLTASRFLCGDRLTEADWRLFTTLLRFDLVYNGHFKCNLRRLVDYPALWSYTRELFQHPGVRETVDFEHIKRHYYESHRHINPTGIVPAGPVLVFETPGSRTIPKTDG